jgi:hypothetical protein
MVAFRRGLAVLVCSPLVAAAPAAAEPGMCRVINIDFTPGGIPAGARGTPPVASPEIAPQIVAWLETPNGEYLQTIYITQRTGRYGIGNRPGRFDFNSGPSWPYGRRTTVLPVWAHRHGVVFPQLEFQSGQDSELSHAFQKSSRETHFCRPLLPTEALWDAATCSSSVYTDKGTFGTSTSRYPPRSDVTPSASVDSPSVAMYRTMNQFDSVSQATPRIGTASQISWPIPPTLPMGDYVAFLEVALEQDFNAAFPATRYPPPDVSYGQYGVPYRGQPSVVYRVPFTIASTETFATADTYAGYGDPDGGPKLHPPDATITTNTPNTGASRLLMTSKDGQTFRVRVDARPEPDLIAPGGAGDMVITAAASSTATLEFVAPGDDGAVGTVRGYEVRYLVGDEPITAATFEASNAPKFTVEVVPAGQLQSITVSDLLPETPYTIAVRAYDDCRNTSSIVQATFTTAERKSGQVDACFIATAAYGSRLANDVDMLRHFRDALLERSVLGELAVETYYTFGPPLAGVVGESDLLRSTAREALGPMVNWVRGFRL